MASTVPEPHPTTNQDTAAIGEPHHRHIGVMSQNNDATIGSPRAMTVSTSTPRAGSNPWKSKAILSLDGGGVRGYGSLLMLHYLMKAIRKIEESHEDPHASSFHPLAEDIEEEPEAGHGLLAPNPSDLGGQDIIPTLSTQNRQFPLFRKRTVVLPQDKDDVEKALKPHWDGYYPCHYFDYIGGTSTGGLNAIMLGRLRMDVDQCIAIYPNMATNIFSFPRIQFKGWPKSKHDNKRLENEIRRIVAIRLKRQDKDSPQGKPPKEDWQQFPSPEDLCRTVVVAKQKIDELWEEVYLFRTYDQKNRAAPGVNMGEANNHAIWQVGRATSAALTLFDPIEIKGFYYTDGGVRFNNPAFEVYKDAQSKEDPDVSIDFVLSIGTGGDDTNRRIPDQSTKDDLSGNTREKKRRRTRKFIHMHLSALAATLAKEVTDVSAVDHTMQHLAGREGFDYYRWTGGRPLTSVKLDSWKPSKGSKSGTQEKIDGWIQTYMQDHKRQMETEKIAKFLVERRRKRCTDQDKWTRFSHCTKVRCPWCRTKKEERQPTRAELVKHVREQHEGLHPDDLEAHASSLPLRPPQIVGGPF